MKKTWEEHEREDLRHIPALQKMGFKVEFHRSDELRRKTSPGNPPENAVTFSRGTLKIWQFNRGWMAADYVKGRYHNHRARPHLNQLILLEQNS